MFAYFVLFGIRRRAAVETFLTEISVGRRSSTTG